MRFPSHLVGAFLPNRMDPRLLHFRPKNGFSPFLMIFDTFFDDFYFYTFVTFSLFTFSCFITFSDFDDFLIFDILSILMIFE